jgi:hypothetical protein
MDKYSSFPAQRSISPYPTYGKFNYQPDTALERKNQSFNNLSSVTEQMRPGPKASKPNNTTQAYRPSNFLVEPVSEWEERRKRMYADYNSFVNEEFKKRIRNREKAQSPEPKLKEAESGTVGIASKEIQVEQYSEKKDMGGLREFDVYRPVLRNDRFRNGEEGNGIEYEDKQKIDRSKADGNYVGGRYESYFQRDPYRDLAPFRSELSYHRDMSRKRLLEPQDIKDKPSDIPKELIKEPSRDVIEPPRKPDPLEDISYTSPIIRTKFHSSMECNDVERLREDAKKAFYQDLERQLQEKRKREEEERKREIEAERREEEKLRKEREELKKKFRSELKKEHPSIYYEDTTRRISESESDKPPSQPTNKEQPKAQVSTTPQVEEKKEPEIRMSFDGKGRYNEIYDGKLGLINEHAGLRYLIDQLKREADDAKADKELAQKELERLKEDLKMRGQMESNSFIKETAYNYRTPYYRPLNQIEVSFIAPEKQLNNDRRFLSFAGKSIINSPALPSSYTTKTYLDKRFENLLYKPSNKLDSTTTYEYPIQDSSNLFITQHQDSFFESSKLTPIQEPQFDHSFNTNPSLPSVKSSIKSSSPEISRQSSQLTSNPDSEFGVLAISAV